MHAELRLGEGVRCGRKRVERLMRQAGIAGIYRRRRRGCTRRDPAAQPADDLVNRAFDPAEPDRLWMMDVTEHPTGDGKIYLAVVLEAFSRMVVGWSIADHMRAELVVDALQMALWRRRPPAGDGRALRSRGPIHELGVRAAPPSRRPARLDGLHRRLLRQLASSRASSARCSSSSSTSITGPTANSSASAIFEWIECWYNPRRRHSYCGMLSPADYEAAHTPPPVA